MADDFSSSEIRARTGDGKQVVLRANEPRPDLEPLRRPSRLVEPGRLGVAGVRLQVESVLDRGCGEDTLPQLMALGQQVVPVLLKIAAAQDEDCGCRCGRRLGAIAALGHFPRADTADQLTGLVKDRSEDVAVRAGAALSLGRIASSSGVAELGRILRADPDVVMRRAAARGLAYSLSLDALDTLEAAATGDADARVKIQAYAALRGLEKRHGRRLTAVKPPPAPKPAAPVRVAAPGVRATRPQRGSPEARPYSRTGRAVKKARKR